MGRSGGGASLITLTTDFGTRDPFVGIMKGVIATRAPAVRVVDVTHDVPPQDVLAGALVLRHAAPFFPRGTVHVGVVDPGVGSTRRALCVETDTALFVGPDNGILSLASPPDDVRRIVELTEERFFLSPRSNTFHGRDVFAPVAAALATGTQPDELGPTVAAMERLTLPEPNIRGGSVHGQVIYVDHFGNLVTNVPAAMAPEKGVVRCGDRRVVTASTYAAVQPGEAVAVVDSWGLVEIAVRNGSAASVLGAGVGSAVVLERS